MSSRIVSEVPGRKSEEVPRPRQIFDPVARALDEIGERWTLVLLRHLISGPKGFNDLRARTGITPRVLSSRLRQLTGNGFVEAVQEDGRPAYAVTEFGRSVEPLIAAIARWYVHHAVHDLDLDTQNFTDSSPLSILESLPFLLREDRSAGVDLTFEIRLSGEGGGVWTVHILDGTCSVRSGFAESADVRYTADSRVWCAVALGYVDPRDAIKRGHMSKDGGRQALDHYFHQVAKLSISGPEGEGDTEKERKRP